MTDRNGRPVLDKDGKRVMTTKYTYERPDGTKIVIQDHSAGHQYPGGIGDQKPHINVRPAENTRTGKVLRTQEHYPH